MECVRERTAQLLCLLRLTDAFNSARDRVRYLETLSPHLEALEGTPSLSSLLSSILPAIMTSIKQMEGLSRGFARSGYLGILLTKVIKWECFSRQVIKDCLSTDIKCTGENMYSQSQDLLQRRGGDGSILGYSKFSSGAKDETRPGQR